MQGNPPGAPVALQHAPGHQIEPAVVDPLAVAGDAFAGESEPFGDGAAACVLDGAVDGHALQAQIVEQVVQEALAAVRLFRAGDLDAAAEAFYPYVPLMRFEFQEGLGMAIRKEVLRRRGAMACADIRPPGAKLDAATMAALDRVLVWTETRK